MTKSKIIAIARVAHEINRAYCQAIGEPIAQLPWEDAPDWQRETVIKGVEFHLAGNFGPAASHESWMREKVANGWTYGPEKNPDLKTHPCLVPFEELPDAQKAKDYLFRAVVHALALPHASV